MTTALVPDRGANTAALLLRTVLARGPVTRGDIAGLTGLSPAGVSRQYAGLADLGLLTARPVPHQRAAGRPHLEIDIATDAHTILGVHIAHRFATLAAVDLRGRVQVQEVLPHPSGPPERILAGIAARLRRFQRHQLRGRVPLGLGVACGGWVDSGTGVIVEHSALGWYDVPAGAILAELTGLPTRVDGHARALACAEAMFGAARGRQSLVHLFVGNVVDAAIVSEGWVYRGPGSAAGTVAHLPLGDPATPCSCGRSGCFEAEVAEWAVIAGLGGHMSIMDVVAAAESGARAARAVLLRRARIIGRAVALLFDVINPEVLVVTEPGVRQLPECLAALRAEVAARSRVRVDPVDRVVATSFPSAELLGTAAGAVQLDALYTDPRTFLRQFT